VSYFMLGVFLLLISFGFFNFPSHYQIRYLKDLVSFHETNSILALSLTLLLFYMAGTPPLLGFFLFFYFIA
jgi:NADH:ubiquinone oxidoreductase subunit 2 (subunit N)